MTTCTRCSGLKIIKLGGEQTKCASCNGSGIDRSAQQAEISKLIKKKAKQDDAQVEQN